jgi:hypothetical protein
MPGGALALDDNAARHFLPALARRVCARRGCRGVPAEGDSLSEDTHPLPRLAAASSDANDIAFYFQTHALWSDAHVEKTRTQTRTQPEIFRQKRPEIPVHGLVA